MGVGSGLSQPSAWWNCRRVIALFLAVLLMSACSPPNQANQKKAAELSQEIKALKAQIAAMQAKLDKLQGGQQAILALMKQSAPVSTPTTAPLTEPQVIPGPSLTVGQLLASKDRYLGARVTVKGVVGPVLMHHQSFMLQSSRGMVEVLFGNLPDPKTIQTLTNTPIENKTVTVTGVVNLSPAQGAGAQLQIRAEAVQF
jgi:outer membrane murein-binding lipoprotein Lpp